MDIYNMHTCIYINVYYMNIYIYDYIYIYYMNIYIIKNTLYEYIYN